MTKPRQIKDFLTDTSKKANKIRVAVTSMCAGDAHSIALGINGDVYGWGYNNSGQIGLGPVYGNNTLLQVRQPTRIESLKSTTITKIYAGQTMSLFINDRRNIFGCGLNDHSQLNIDAPSDFTKNPNSSISTNKINAIYTPRKIEFMSNAIIKDIDCGSNHSLAIALVDKHYELLGFGMNKHGQLGIGNINSNFTKNKIVKTFNDCMISKLGCGGYHSAVIIGEVQKSFNNEIYGIVLSTLDNIRLAKNSLK